MQQPRRLSSKELNAAVDVIFAPAGKGLTSDEIDFLLIEFCLNCPDPRGAMDLVIEAPQGTTSEQVVRQALSMQPRSIDTWSAEELHPSHPLRHLRLPSE